jgi:hypothetical protein
MNELEREQVEERTKKLWSYAMAVVPLVDAALVGVSIRGSKIDHVTAIEALGFDSVWTGEHILFHGPVTDGLITLAACAGKTSRITIGGAINLLPLRPSAIVPAQASRMPFQFLPGNLHFCGECLAGRETRRV